MPKRRPLTHRSLQITVAGIEFPNPVGLAAGCDKNARAVTMWPNFGFGYVEVGTITAQPQPGNPRPRVFRLTKQHAVINRLGFNSEGSELVARRLGLVRERSHRLSVPLGINIGKTKQVRDDELVLEDYRAGFRRLAPFADYVVINVSSPNTPGLRQWQQRAPLTSLLSAMSEEAVALAESAPDSRANQLPVPIFVKISPDMSESDMEDLVEVVADQQMAGIIATNTTVSRPGIEDQPSNSMEGGLSGRPLRRRADEVIRFLFRTSQGRFPLIGVGGIDSAEAAYHRIRSGASLIQLYTGMIYEGPYLAKRINLGLIKLLQQDGIDSVKDLVGVDA
jgi:dihydroorotate dehydrogenase